MKELLMMNIQEAKHHLTGPVMSFHTPFDKEGLIDYQGSGRVIDRALEGSSPAVMLTPGDSHYFCLSDDEIADLTRFTCKHVAKRAMVIAADRNHSTDRSVEFAQFCQDAGADMFMALPPDWTSSCTSETLAQHYAAIAQVMPVMIVTCVFSPHGPKFGLETIERTLDISPNVVAIKDDLCGTFGQDLCVGFSDRVAIIAGGQKRNHLNMWPYGCDGYLSTQASFNTDISTAYWQAIQSNDIASAVKIITSQDMPLFKYLLTLEGGFDAGMHGMLELYGLAKRYRRKPYYTMSDEQLEKLKVFLIDTKLLS